MTWIDQLINKQVLKLTDHEIEEMQKQIRREAGLPPEEGGVDVPDDSDGVTRKNGNGGDD